jgi:hypothetical protein
MSQLRFPSAAAATQIDLTVQIKNGAPNALAVLGPQGGRGSASTTADGWRGGA